MQDVFFPAEHAILCDWFGIPRPPSLEGVSTYASAEQEDDQDDPQRPILIVANEVGTIDLELPNAVARICLNAIQARLPQFVVVEGQRQMASRVPDARRQRAIELLPQRLFTINWADTAPGISWPEAYYVTPIPGYDRLVVTASQESSDAWGCDDIAIGWFPIETPIEQGAKQIITAKWKELADNYGQQKWAYLFDTGLIDRDTADQWADEVWIQDDGNDGATSASQASKAAEVAESALWTGTLPKRYDMRTLKELWRNLTGMSLVEDSAFLEELRIQDTWMGLAEPSSRSTEYRLQRKADYLKGYRVSPGGEGRSTPESREQVQPIPDFVVRYVLGLLENARLIREVYRPTLECTDDYPSIQLQLLVGEHLIEFYTQSQGEDHVPWAVVCGEGRWVTHSTAPSRALAALMPYLTSGSEGKCRSL